MTLKEFREQTKDLPDSTILAVYDIELDWYREVNELIAASMERSDEAPRNIFWTDVEQELKTTFVLGIKHGY